MASLSRRWRNENQTFFVRVFVHPADHGNESYRLSALEADARTTVERIGALVKG